MDAGALGADPGALPRRGRARRRPSGALSWSASAATTRRSLAEVLRLLAEDARGGSLLDRDLAEVAAPDARRTTAGASHARLRPLPRSPAAGRGRHGRGLPRRARRPGQRAPRSRSCATPGSRRRAASASPASSGRWPSSTTLHRAAATTPTRSPTARRGSSWSTSRACPLTEYCRTRTAPRIRGRLELFRAVCEAVQHAHRHRSSTATSSRPTSWSPPTAR